jgi:hypothetical protein
MLLCCASCANGESDTPEGMKNATAAGSDFRFYIPSYWNVSTDYGVSGGYYGTAGQAKASLVKYTLTAEQIAARNEAVAGGKSPIAWFWESECYPALVRYAMDGQVEHVADQDADVLLGSLNGYCAYLFKTPLTPWSFPTAAMALLVAASIALLARDAAKTAE